MNCRFRKYTTYLLFLAAVAASAASSAAQNNSPNPRLTVLYTFTGQADGGQPLAGVSLDPAGNVYGTTPIGGDFGGDCTDGTGCGVAFKIDPRGHETVLHAFTGGADGAQPSAAGLLRDSSGVLYGTADGGGAYGAGVVYKLSPSPTFCPTAFCPWNESVLYSFGSISGDGISPYGSLIRDVEGNLYGTTQYGGGTGCGGRGCGTVFKVDPQGNETVLYSFQGPPGDGYYPFGTLLRDGEGNLYGTTYAGGSGSCSYGAIVGCGIVFKIDTSGNESIIHNSLVPQEPMERFPTPEWCRTKPATSMELQALAG